MSAEEVPAVSPLVAAWRGRTSQRAALWATLPAIDETDAFQRGRRMRAYVRLLEAHGLPTRDATLGALAARLKAARERLAARQGHE